MNYYDHLAEWIFSPERTPMQKAAVILTVLAGSVILNDVFGFSLYYHIHRKVEQFSQLTSIIKDPATDSAGKLHAISLRERVLAYEPYSSASFERRNGNLPSSHDNHHNINAVPTTTKILPKDSIKNNFWFWFSTTGIYLIFLPITFLVTISRVKTAIKAETFTRYYVMFLCIFLTTTIINVIMSQIPVIRGNEEWNYILNFILQAGSILIIHRNFRRFQKPKRR